MNLATTECWLPPVGLSLSSRFYPSIVHERWQGFQDAPSQSNIVLDPMPREDGELEAMPDTARGIDAAA